MPNDEMKPSKEAVRPDGALKDAMMNAIKYAEHTLCMNAQRIPEAGRVLSQLADTRAAIIETFTYIATLEKKAAMQGWRPIAECPPTGGEMIRFHYAYGQESVLSYDYRRASWVNFEGDINYDVDNHGLGEPTHWQEYVPPAPEGR